MGPHPLISPQSDSHRYEAVLRISEAIAACREPEELATTLASEIGKFLHFEHLYFVVLKENGKEIEYLVWGKGQVPLPDLPMEELPWWEAVRSRDPQHTADWDTEERYPRFKEWAKKMGLGSGLRVPLTTPHRRLGVFGINRDTVNPFSEEEISFLRLIGRVVAFALDDGLNFRRAQHQNDQLQLLLDLTDRIPSYIVLRDLLRAIAANIREVIRADAVDVALPDAVSDKLRVFAMDFPHGKGVVKEELLVTPSAAVKKALATLKPVVVDLRERNEFTPEASYILAAEGIKTFCNIPLVNRGRALGILSILRTTETAFTPEAVDFLSRASGPIAIAVENAVARAQLQQQNEPLHRSQRELREVIEGIPSMAWSTAPDGTAEFFNRRWLDYAGLSPDQLRGRGWTIAVHPDDLRAVVYYWRGVLASREPGEIEARLRRFDGVYRWFLFRAIPFFDDNGGIVKWFGTNTDIGHGTREERA